MLNILLIEDNPSDANLLSELFKQSKKINFNIKWFKRLKEGLNSFNKRNTDIILLDLSLPDSWGLETINQTLEIVEDVPIIVLTGMDDDILAVESVKKGAQDYLVKGQVDSTSISRSVQYAIERKRLERILKESKEKLRESEDNLKILNQDLEQLVKERTYDMNERVKELFCLYDVSKIVAQRDITIKDAFQKIVNRIPAAMQYPEETCSRIVFNSQEFKTMNFKETKWKLSTKFAINSKKIGSIEINYLNEKPECYEGPFFKEERNLIDAIAEMVRGFVDRLQAEYAIKQAHTELYTIFNTAGGGMRVVDIDHNVLRINSPFAELVGASEAELEGQKCFEQFSGPNCLTPQCTMNRIVAGEERIDIEMVKKRKDGRDIPCILVASPFRSAEGELLGMVEDFTDITDRKRAEAATQQAHSEITTIFNAAGDGMRVVDTEYIVLRVNHEFAELVGASEAELIGQKCYEQFPHPQCHTPQCTLKRILSGEERIETDVVKERKNDREILCILVATPFRSADGELLGMVEAFKDITDRKRAEKDLQESEEKFRTLVKTSPYSIILLDTKGNILDCNQITERYLGLPRNEIIGTMVFNLDIISENDKDLIANRIQELIKSGITEPREFEFKNSEGEKIWLENILSYIKIGGKDYIQINSVDITERKKMEIINEKKIEKLKELDKLKNEFVLRASHELKTPLNSIYGASTILLDYYHKFFDDRAKRLLEIINTGGERLKKLVIDLIDVSRIESNVIELNKQKENLEETIKSCVNDLYHSIVKRELFLHVDLEEEIYLEVDKIRIDQVIMNLVSNAIKNTLPKGTISVILQKYDDHIEIKIKDTGVGFTEDEKKKVFKKFGKIERYGKGMDIDTEGSGLGLYLSKEIIELHGGKIWLESEGRNKGSKFIINLPIK